MKSLAEIEKEVGEKVYQRFQEEAGRLVRYAENVEGQSPERALLVCVNQVYNRYRVNMAQRAKR